MRDSLNIMEMLADAKRFIQTDEFIEDIDSSLSIGSVVLKYLHRYETEKYPTDSVFIMNVIWRMRVSGINQKMLVSESGISKSTIARILDGKTDPKLSQMIKIAEVLKSSPEQLLTIRGVAAIDELAYEAFYESHSHFLFQKLVHLVRDCKTCSLMLKDVFDIPLRYHHRTFSGYGNEHTQRFGICEQCKCPKLETDE